MKKALSIALITVLVLAFSVPALAAPAGKGPAGIESDAVLEAEVVKDKGKTNTLYLTVNGVTEEFIIENNAKGLYEVDGYVVFVGTYGNIKICDLYVVSEPEVEEDPYIIRITVIDASVSLDVTVTPGNTNIYIFTIVETIEILWSNGDTELDYITSIEPIVLSSNYEGEVEVLCYTVFMDIAGNGSNIKIPPYIVDFEERVIYP